MLEVIPAIDVSRGRLATFTPGGPKPVGAFGGDPVAAAAAAVDAGARRLHVVDMDLALEGEARNLDVVEAIAGLRIPVQASGGMRTEAEIGSFLLAGASRVVLGSGALADAERTGALLGAHAARLVAGIEVEDGRIRSRGRDPVDLGLMETLGWLAAAGARMFLVTSVSRVGRLRGPDVELVRRASRAGRPVLAAGGVASIQDLHDIRAAGAVGAIVGRAALEGSLDLSAAIAELA